MSLAHLEIELDAELVRQLDAFVVASGFANRDEAIAHALQSQIQKRDRQLLARECEKLDPAAEQAFAEEGFAEDLKEWPTY